MKTMGEIFLVTGAPGAGKSTTVRELLTQETPFTFFDIDWLADAAGTLAGRSIYTDATTWQPYDQLWFEILRATLNNGQQPVLFCPNEPADFAPERISHECSTLHWLLLDCDDDCRLARLAVRKNWTATRKQEALADAAALRGVVDHAIDTGHLPPAAVAKEVLDWLQATAGSNTNQDTHEPGMAQ